MYKNRFSGALRCKLGLSHDYATEIRNRTILPWIIAILSRNQGEIIESSKGHACKGQDRTTCKNPRFYDIAVAITEVHTLFAMLIIEGSTG
ncbi:hypothetical protein OIU79_023959 [Salix purpurea]|uniref:Uncharacterized protein n=1 Tax=Salix purpurea TaxID=77065 RepID=A0A9Q0WCQ3_SALPP|nr:hypothetical protein OIU79_023959 [Salix purpurea]